MGCESILVMTDNRIENVSAIVYGMLLGKWEVLFMRLLF